MKRIGFACKFMHHDQTQKKKLLEEIQRPLNTRSTTVAWLNRQTKEVAEQRLWDIMVHNIESYKNLINYVGGLKNELRMVRLGSDVLPVYTEPTWSYYWHLPDVRNYCERAFAPVGKLARNLDVRLSMHPGQFTVLASDSDDIVNRSIEEFEYHVDIARWMGYGVQFQDFKINVHISGKKGPTGIKECLNRLSPEARNTITIENDENSWGLDASLELSRHCGLVVDIHHHWVKTGEYIGPDDDRIKRVIDSWRGVRPTMHYSLSKETYIPEQSPYKKPNMEQLSFAPEFDIMVEAKHKNLANKQLYDHYKQNILQYCHK